MAARLVAIVSCLAAADALAQQAAPATVDWRNAAESAAWIKAESDALDAAEATFFEGVPLDVSDFCPAFAGLDIAGRKTFWMSFLADIAWAESGDAPDLVRWHLYDRAAHRPTFRRGLFQIAIESANNKDYTCAVARAKDLEHADLNIRCAVSILGSSLHRDGAIARNAGAHAAGAARYWQALRNERSRREIARSTAALPECHTPST